MNTLKTEYQVNEQGMIVEEIHKSEIDDVIQSIQEIDKEIEKLILNIFPIIVCLSISISSLI